MLKYDETNWKYEQGLQTCSYQVIFDKINSHSTIEEQKQRAERLSLVKSFDHKQSKHFLRIAKHFQENDDRFYFNKNKMFHTTLLGFPVIDSEYYKVVRQEIKRYFEGMETRMNVKFDQVRLGTKYENTNTLRPIYGLSNGSVVAVGPMADNMDFVTSGNRLACSLVRNEDLGMLLGKKFRRRFPAVWCTLGYYTNDFKIESFLEMMFHKYRTLNPTFFHIPCYEVELGTSHYKDLRDWKRIETFSLQRD